MTPDTAESEHDDERHLDRQAAGVARDRLPFGRPHPALPRLERRLVQPLAFALLGA
jgi:hypothetical protein